VPIRDQVAAAHERARQARRAGAPPAKVEQLLEEARKLERTEARA